MKEEKSNRRRNFVLLLCFVGVIIIVITGFVASPDTVTRTYAYWNYSNTTLSQTNSDRYSTQFFESELPIDHKLSSLDRQTLETTIDRFIQSCPKKRKFSYLEWGSAHTRIVNPLLSPVSDMATIEHVSHRCAEIMNSAFYLNTSARHKLEYICVKHNYATDGNGFLLPRDIPKPEIARLAKLYIDDAFDTAVTPLIVDVKKDMNYDTRFKNALDIVLIDGRYRVACALKLLDMGAIRCADSGWDNNGGPHSIVILNNNTNSDAYDVLFNYYDVIHRNGTDSDNLVLLKCRQIISPNHFKTHWQLKSDMRKYYTIQD